MIIKLKLDHYNLNRLILLNFKIDIYFRKNGDYY